MKLENNNFLNLPFYNLPKQDFVGIKLLEMLWNCSEFHTIHYSYCEFIQQDIVTESKQMWLVYCTSEILILVSLQNRSSQYVPLVLFSDLSNQPSFEIKAKLGKSAFINMFSFYSCSYFFFIFHFAFLDGIWAVPNKSKCQREDACFPAHRN